MLRFKILVSVVPLWSPPLFARVELIAGAAALHRRSATQSVQIASDALACRPSCQLSPTIPRCATVRVQIADSAEAADFAVVDDVDSAEDSACEVNAATQFVAISGHARRHRAA